jgi:hypothetical protein
MKETEGWHGGGIVSYWFPHEESVFTGLVYGSLAHKLVKTNSAVRADIVFSFEL